MLNPSSGTEDMQLNINSCITLSNGTKMPLLGLGTFQAQGAAVKNSVLYALHNGYRHIDTASGYRNEAEVATAIQESGIGRDDLFISSKVGPHQHGYEQTIAACKESLKNLSIQSLDLYLVHWPGLRGMDRNSEENKKGRAQTWKAMEALYKEGKCKAIGVSNYTVKHLETLLSECSVPPMVNQVELHPYLQQKELLAFCEKHNIKVEAYTSLGQGKLLQDADVQNYAKSLDVTPSQFLLRWAVQQQIPVIPKTVNLNRIIENSKLFHFSIPEEVMQKMLKLERNFHFCWDPTDVK